MVDAMMISNAGGEGAQRRHMAPLLPEPSMASTIAEDPSQEYDLRADDFVPDFVDRTLGATEVVGAPHTVSAEERTTSWEDIHIGDLVQAEGQPAYR
jgi:hypothetical protein